MAGNKAIRRSCFKAVRVPGCELRRNCDEQANRLVCCGRVVLAGSRRGHFQDRCYAASGRSRFAGHSLFRRLEAQARPTAELGRLAARDRSDWEAIADT